MKISVIGTGYVGLVTGTCFAETGNDVLCMDISQTKIDQLNNGKIPIYEPGLKSIFDRNVREKRLKFSTDLATAVKHADLIFLALPTPPGKGGAADLSYVLGVSEEIATLLDEYKILVNKSTVPVGTAEKVTAVVNAKTKVDFDVVSNPEFLREGKAVEDFMRPDRVVVGTNNSKRAELKMRQLYDPFVRQGNPIYFMDWRSAEMTKYAANAYLATRISYMNEIANLCELLGADVDHVRIGVGSDNRIGKQFLFPGVGYGGSCFPKDVEALARKAEESDYNFQILNAVMEVNKEQRVKLFPKLKAYYNNELKGLNIAVWGLAFKPDTDDIREAPSLYLIDQMLEAGINVSVFDPEAMNNVKAIYGDKLTYSEDQYDVLKNADALVIVTEWKAFRTPDFSRVTEMIGKKVIFDGRNLYKPEWMEKWGFYYSSIGRKTVEQTN